MTPSQPDLAIQIEAVMHEFLGSDGQSEVALEDISLDVDKGSLTVLIGPSGCGKSTLLNLVAGVFPPSEGAIRVAGEVVRGPRRDVGYMIARDALLPWRKARKNVELFLEGHGQSRGERRARATELLERLGLGEYQGAYRYQLSQGMRQRVSLARTLAPDPDVLLMDEPFAALDAQTRHYIQEWFLEIWEQTGKSVLFVTHDLEEALLLGDRIVVLSRRPGRIHADRSVPLPRPRGALADWLFTAEFRELHEELWHTMGEASTT